MRYEGFELKVKDLEGQVERATIDCHHLMTESLVGGVASPIFFNIVSKKANIQK